MFVDGFDRWAIYHRLQSLGIDCACQTGAPLKSKLLHPMIWCSAGM
ncbi:Asr1405/Asl0597 family protein [Romeriopsis navalis]